MSLMGHGAKELESLIFRGIKAQLFGDTKVLASVSYLTTFGYLENNSLRILKSCGTILLTFKFSPKIFQNRLCRYL